VLSFWLPLQGWCADVFSERLTDGVKFCPRVDTKLYAFLLTKRRRRRRRKHLLLLRKDGE